MQSRVLRLLAFVCLTPLGCASAWAVNKCVGADGAVTYTDGACNSGSKLDRVVETPPPMSREEEREARLRSREIVQEARELDARQNAERLERQRQAVWAAQQQQAAEQQAAQQSQAAQDRERLIVVQPVARRYLPPVPVVPVVPKPAAPPEREVKARGYPSFR